MRKILTNKHTPALLVAAMSLSCAAYAASPAAVSNDKVTKDLGKNSSEVNTHAIPLKPVSAAQKQENKEAAAAINKVPGINIEGKDLQPPAEDAEIKGFHPIKRLLAPVIRLGKGAVELQQQVMKLEGPIGALEPSMNSLATKMQNVDNRLGDLDKNVVSTEKHVVDLDHQMAGIRSELREMASDVQGLHGPLQSVLQPLTNVKGPLHEMNEVLADMNSMVKLALIAIFLLTIGIVFGTPFAAILVYQHRRRIFPYMKEHEFPKFDGQT
ncbi:hypothetical protein BH11CYA1_BH11CYA1_02160 [soil metagenome]